MRGRIRIQPVVRKVKDPVGDIIAAADLLDDMDGGRSPTPWMQRLAGRAKSPVRAHQSGLTVYDGRACCYEHLTAYEGRPDMKFPMTTCCPNCGAEYEIALRAVRVGL